MSETPFADALAGSRAELVRIALRIVGSREGAEDVVQDAIVRALERSDAAPDAPAAWLATVVRHLAIDRLRRARLERGVPTHDAADGAVIDALESPAGEALRRERCREAVRALLEGTDPRDAATVLLREVFGVDYRRLAELSGRREPACRQAVRRALRRARNRTRDETDPARPAPRAVADAVLERFASSVLVGEPAALFDVLRVAANDLGGPESATRCGTRVGVDGRGVYLELVLGGTVLCRLAPSTGHRASPDVSRVVATP